MVTLDFSLTCANHVLHPSCLRSRSLPSNSMAAAQSSWLVKMRISLCLMAKAASSVADPCHSQPSLQLHACILSMQALRRTLKAVQPDKLEPLDTHTQCDYDLLLLAFIKLLTILVPQLEKHGYSTYSTARGVTAQEEEMFWELWNVAVAGSSALGLAIEAGLDIPSFQTANQPPYASLFAAFHSLLAWLLKVSRTPAWRLMGPANGIRERNQGLATILQVPSRCFLVFSLSGPIAVSNYLCHLPHDLLPLLCCIASEQFGTAPLVVPQSQSVLIDWSATSCPHHGNQVSRLTSTSTMYRFLLLLTRSIFQLMQTEACGQTSAQASFLTTPAVLQSLKVILLLACEPSCTEPSLWKYCVSCLLRLLSVSNDESKTYPTQPLCASDRKYNRDCGGLPLHLNPLLSSSAMETDARVLRALSMLTRWKPACVEICLQVQTLIIASWELAGRLYRAPAVALAIMANSIACVAKECANHGLQIMQLVLPKKTTAISRKYPARQHQACALAETSPSTIYDKKVLDHVLSLVIISSKFRLQTPNNQMQADLGE